MQGPQGPCCAVYMLFTCAALYGIMILQGRKRASLRPLFRTTTTRRYNMLVIATPKQISFIEDLVMKRIDWDKVPGGWGLEKGLVKALMNHHDPEEASFTKKDASSLIDSL